VSEPVATPAPGEKRRRLPTLKQLGDWAGSLHAIVTLVILVGGGVAAILSNHFTGWITGGDTSPAAKVARLGLQSPSPTSQDDRADTYTLRVAFDGYGKQRCSLEWLRFDGANAAIGRPALVACAGSGRFVQDVRIPVPQGGVDRYRVRFRLRQGTRVLAAATTKTQYIP
jgi:hypothetical protein